MIVPKLPPRHMTARAMWWIRESVTIMPHNYPTTLPPALAACVDYRASQLLAQERARLEPMFATMLLTHDVAYNMERDMLKTPDAWRTLAASIMASEGVQTQVIKGWASGVQDVRAYYIQQATATANYQGDLVQKRDGADTVMCIDAEPLPGNPEHAWHGGPRLAFTMKVALLPTCSECMVQWYAAMAQCTPKTGKYPTKVGRHNQLENWKELK